MSVAPTGGRYNLHQFPKIEVKGLKIKGCVPARWETDIDALKIEAERKSSCEADRNACNSVTVVVPKLSTPPQRTKNVPQTPVL